jgi:hypothetical protein
MHARTSRCARHRLDRERDPADGAVGGEYFARFQCVHIKSQRALGSAFVHVGAAAGMDDGAAVHHHELVAELTRNRDIARPARPRSARDCEIRMARPISLMIEGWILRSARRAAGAAAATSARRSRAALATREVAAAPAQHVVEHRKQRKHVVGIWRSSRLSGEAGLEVLLDG